jgi:hypothetical protein
MRSFSARSSGRSFAYAADLSTIAFNLALAALREIVLNLILFCSLLVSKEPSSVWGHTAVVRVRSPLTKCRILWPVCRLRVYAALRFIVSINILVPPPLLHTIWLLPLAAALIKLTLVRPQIATHIYICHGFSSA